MRELKDSWLWGVLSVYSIVFLVYAETRAFYWDEGYRLLAAQLIAAGKNWSTYERLAKKINEVTPPKAPLFADEPIYFATKRIPPPGLELAYTHELNLPAAESAPLHILNADQLKRQVQSGMFTTACSCDDDDANEYGLKNIYKQHVEMEDCSIFWDRKK